MKFIIKHLVEKKRVLLWTTCAIIFILAALLVAYSFIFSQNEENLFTIKDSVYATDVSWKINTENAEFPIRYKGVRNSSIVLETTVPADVEDDWGVMTYALYSTNLFYVNDELIYSYGTQKPLKFGNMVGNVRVIAPLSRNMAGKKLTVIIQPHYSQNMDVDEPEFGPTFYLQKSVFKDNFVRLLICCFMAIILLLGIGLLAYEVHVKAISDAQMVMHFIFFVLFVLLWILCSSDLPQFITDSSEAVSLVSFLSLSMMCIPYTGFCKVIFIKGKKLFSFLWEIGFLLPIINGVCFVANICDPMTLLPLSHVYIFVSALTSLIYAAKQWRIDTNSKLLCIGLMFIVFGAIAGLIFFFIAPSKGYAATAFGAGFAVFFVFAMWLMLRRQIEYIKESQFISTYKTLAYTDVLTNLENRAAFDAEFEGMKYETMLGKEVELILFDINRLKETNDSIGHQAGDKLIMSTGECISRVFNKDGKCYRLGGDEFAVVMINKSQSVRNLLVKFENEVQNFNKFHAFPISVAYGYANREWQDNVTYLRELYKEADTAMHEMKSKMHLPQ